LLVALSNGFLHATCFFDGTPVGGALGGEQGLQALCLAGCRRLTAAAVAKVARPHGVRFLSLAYCAQFDDAAMATIFEAHPNIEVLTFLSDIPLCCLSGIISWMVIAGPMQ
jgi:hypothetical protein